MYRVFNCVFEFGDEKKEFMITMKCHDEESGLQFISCFFDSYGVKNAKLTVSGIKESIKVY